MQQDASSQRKIPVQRRVYQVVLLLIFILFPNAMSLSLKLLSSSSLPLCPKPLIKLCWVTWDPWCFITRTGFAQALHHWDPGNANPPTTSFPLGHLCLLQFPYSFSHNSFLPHSLLKGLHTFSLFFTSDKCVKRMRSESYGHTEVFLKCRIPTPQHEDETQLTCIHPKCRLHTRGACFYTYFLCSNKHIVDI